MSIALGFTGWSSIVCTCAASGTDAIGLGREAIETGCADVLIAGGVEAPLSPAIFRGFDASGALSRERNVPSHEASRPYDRGRDGFVLGEGCGLVVLEGEDHARARGARIYAEVLGYGSATGPFDADALRVDRGTAREAVRMALDDAACPDDRVDLVASSAASEIENDRVESALVREQYRSDAPPVTSIRSMVGQCLGAMGGIGAVASVLSIARGCIPPTINYAEPDPACPMASLVTAGRAAALRRVVQHGFGYLATQSALVWGSLAS
jgi:3-oxoacyl-(acyl-carrier-protein) synthase